MSEEGLDEEECLQNTIDIPVVVAKKIFEQVKLEVEKTEKMLGIFARAHCPAYLTYKQFELEKKKLGINQRGGVTRKEQIIIQKVEELKKLMFEKKEKKEERARQKKETKEYERWDKFIEEAIEKAKNMSEAIAIEKTKNMSEEDKYIKLWERLSCYSDIGWIERYNYMLFEQVEVEKTEKKLGIVARARLTALMAYKQFGQEIRDDYHQKRIKEASIPDLKEERRVGKWTVGQQRSSTSPEYVINVDTRDDAVMWMKHDRVKFEEALKLNREEEEARCEDLREKIHSTGHSIDDKLEKMIKKKDIAFTFYKGGFTVYDPATNDSFIGATRPPCELGSPHDFKSNQFDKNISEKLEVAKIHQKEKERKIKEQIQRIVSDRRERILQEKNEVVLVMVLQPGIEKK